MESLKSLFHRYEGMSGLEIAKEHVNEENFKDYVLEVPDFEFDYEDSDFMYDLMDEIKKSLFSKYNEVECYSLYDVDSEMDLMSLISTKIFDDMQNIVKYYNVHVEIMEV